MKKLAKFLYQSIVLINFFGGWSFLYGQSKIVTMKRNDFNTITQDKKTVDLIKEPAERFARSRILINKITSLSKDIQSEISDDVSQDSTSIRQPLRKLNKELSAVMNELKAEVGRLESAIENGLTTCLECLTREADYNALRAILTGLYNSTSLSPLGSLSATVSNSYDSPDSSYKAERLLSVAQQPVIANNRFRMVIDSIQKRVVYKLSASQRYLALAISNSLFITSNTGQRVQISLSDLLARPVPGQRPDQYPNPIYEFAGDSLLYVAEANSVQNLIAIRLADLYANPKTTTVPAPRKLIEKVLGLADLPAQKQQQQGFSIQTEKVEKVLRLADLYAKPRSTPVPDAMFDPLIRIDEILPRDNLLLCRRTMNSQTLLQIWPFEPLDSKQTSRKLGRPEKPILTHHFTYPVREIKHLTNPAKGQPYLLAAYRSDNQTYTLLSVTLVSGEPAKNKSRVIEDNIAEFDTMANRLVYLRTNGSLRYLDATHKSIPIDSIARHFSLNTNYIVYWRKTMGNDKDVWELVRSSFDGKERLPLGLQYATDRLRDVPRLTLTKDYGKNRADDYVLYKDRVTNVAHVMPIEGRK